MFDRILNTLLRLAASFINAAGKQKAYLTKLKLMETNIQQMPRENINNT